MAEEVKRSLKVQFSATGQAKLAADVDKVDRGLTKAGKDGTAALSSMDKGLSGLSKGLAEALDPLDKAFAASDKLFSILGKAGAVGAVAVAAWEGIKAALELFNDSSARAAEKLKAVEEATKLASAEISKYSANLAQVYQADLLLDLMKSSEAFSNAQRAAANAAGVILANERSLEDISRRMDPLVAEREAALAENNLRRFQAAKRELAELDALAQADLKTKADAEKQLNEQSILVQSLGAGLREMSEAAALLAVPFGPEDAPGSATGGPARMADGVDALAMALAQLDEGPVARAFDALREMAGARAAQNLAGASSVLDAYAAAVGRAANAMGVLGEQTAAWWEQQRAASAAVETATGLVDAHGQALAATAYEAIIAGESFETFLNAVAKRATAEAAIEAALYAAKALASFGVGLFTGSPAAFAAAETFAAAALAFGAVATVAGTVAGATGGLRSGGGGGGGGAAGADGLQGAPAQSGPVVVNVNFAGPSSGLGRFLADELNQEGRRVGGARLNSDVVRR